MTYLDRDDIQSISPNADLPLLEEDEQRSVVVVRPDPCGLVSIGQLHSSEYQDIPYKGYTLNSVDDYVLFRMAERISISLAIEVSGAWSISSAFEMIKSHLGDKYNPEEYEDNAADIYCYMVEAYSLLAKTNEEFRKQLIATGNAQIFANDPSSLLNSQWGAAPVGIGPEDQVVRSGHNIMGRALEAVREGLV